VPDSDSSRVLTDIESSSNHVLVRPVTDDSIEDTERVDKEIKRKDKLRFLYQRGKKRQLIFLIVKNSSGVSYYEVHQLTKEFVKRSGFQWPKLDENTVNTTLKNLFQQGKLTRILVDGRYYYYAIDESYSNKETNAEATTEGSR
jgi:hypothetical protein